ncbi:carbonic anhydrase family protein [Crenobacter sp. SG2303]|uniref:carbonic anhydrase n=1 Tax=Crenobacter oryzisoli TaxID=3056844 RepID=A0ABT7XKD9_9NEIS|nr:carbonic anhydrase family protein [Crenobacter sp. SG2303]MDN0074210.1 carbonic anhydrase family protein [Crenobacter sp. SG2303]
MNKNIAVLLLSLFAAPTWAAGASPHWNYKQADWASLAPEFQLCKLGQTQSPIDIRGAKPTVLAPLRFDYRTGSATLVNNGHAIELKPAAGNRLSLAEGDFELLQLHFHAPSEEMVEGKRYPLVAHLVHKNAKNELAVVAVLFELGRDNPALAPLLATLPDQPGTSRPLSAPFDPAALLPAKRDYYAYTGSLTTPPCSEGVRWRVLKQPVELSERQLAALQRLYPMNARPVQPLNGRTILESGG